ncbi:MAG: carboxypeptidase regulatory-like domain-containing protein, partial [Ekhidna sp.]|nr:carboxypeptidase regulatory-like domain-containing protein [Ekhidna sp.]
MSSLFSRRRFCLFSILFSLWIAHLHGQEFKKVNTGAVVKQAKVSFDGTSMVFMANYYGSFKPYIAKYNQDSSMWDQPSQIFESDVIAGYEIRYPQLNFDNTRLYFAGRNEANPNFDVFYSDLQNGEWSAPKEFEIGINTPQDELDFAVSADEKKVLFTRPLPPEEKADDYCGQLYLTEFTEAGVWSEPELLPPSYNTGCICSPYYTRDNKTFFFSSYEDVLDAEGKKIAKKQFSIFWAKIDGLFRYNPRSITDIIGDEDLVSPSMDLDSTLYYNVGEYSKGENKIESSVLSKDLRKEFQPSDMTLISGIVQDENGEPLSATVQAINPYTTKVFQESVSNQDGYYQLFVPTGEQYSLLASKEKYSTQSKLIISESSLMSNNFELFPSVDLTFNVFDQEFYFPISSNVSLYDASFNFIEDLEIVEGEKQVVALGQELNIIINSENYFPDTLNLPFDEEVIFDFFDFDIELTRKLKDVSMSFADESGNNLGLEITVYNVTRNEKTTRTVKDGKITLQLRDGEVYEISTSAEGYSYYSAELDLSEEEELEEMSA